MVYSRWGISGGAENSGCQLCEEQRKGCEAQSDACGVWLGVSRELAWAGRVK
jgi:hypothetical protein